MDPWTYSNHFRSGFRTLLHSNTQIPRRIRLRSGRNLAISKLMHATPPFSLKLFLNIGRQCTMGEWKTSSQSVTTILFSTSTQTFSLNEPCWRDFKWTTRHPSMFSLCRSQSLQRSAWLPILVVVLGQFTRGRTKACRISLQPATSVTRVFTRASCFGATWIWNHFRTNLKHLKSKFGTWRKVIHLTMTFFSSWKASTTSERIHSWCLPKTKAQIFQTSSFSRKCDKHTIQ